MSAYWGWWWRINFYYFLYVSTTPTCSIIADTNSQVYQSKCQEQSNCFSFYGENFWRHQLLLSVYLSMIAILDGRFGTSFCILFYLVGPDSNPVTEIVDKAIPPTATTQLRSLQLINGFSLENAVTFLMQTQVSERLSSISLQRRHSWEPHQQIIEVSDSHIPVQALCWKIEKARCELQHLSVHSWSWPDD